MKCPKCQFENPSDAKFCNDCGRELDLVCEQCNKKNPPGSKFCNECGQDLIKPEEAPCIDYSEPQSYTPKYLADKILITRSSIEGERKLVTVLFADVANFTAISDKLDPEDVHQIMDGCFKILMNEIHKHEGTINQFTGDGVMSLFGAPVAHEDHAQRACHAALSIQKAIGFYSDKLKKDRRVDFKLRIGLNSGPVVVGSIGDDLRMDYTAVGDTTNLASRMESMARPGTIYVSRDTFRLARDFFKFESLGELEVRGKKKPIEAYTLIKAGEVETRIGASVAKGLTRFVGRKNSMAALRDALEETKAGSGQIVGILGEAGVGKSRILFEFKNQLPQSGHVYLEGRCLHFGGSMSYLPFLDILRSYFQIIEGDRETIIKKKIDEKIARLDEKLENIRPPLMELLSLKVQDEDYSELGPQQKKEKTFEAIRNLLIRVSQEKHLVLVVEDLHWIDKTSEELLDYLIGSLTSTHVLLILLYRPEYIHQWGSKSYYRKIGLNQLTTQSSAELIQAILEEGEVSVELREFILNRAAGNPLFMEEFIYTLLENGTIQRKDHQYVLSKKASDIRVPDTIQGIIAARMDRLEDNLKQTMQVASVIGRDFAFRILHEITGLQEKLKAHLLNLQKLEFIYQKCLFPELEYIFKHALIQEVAYNSLLHKRRKKIHEKIGNAIEQIYKQRLEEFFEMLAYHFDAGGVWDKAVKYLVMSGMKARHGYNIQAAIDDFNRAQEILEKYEPAMPWRIRYDLFFEKGGALIDSGQGHHALNELKKATEIAFDHGATNLQVKAMFLQATAARISLEIDQVKVILEEIEPLVIDNRESLLGVVAQQAFCSLALWEDLPMALSKEREMNDLIRRISKSQFYDQAAFCIGIYHRWRGDCKKCSEVLEPVLPVLKASATPILYVNSTFTYALALGEQGHYQKAIRIMEEGRESGIKSGGLYATPILSNSLGWAYHELCQFGRAIDYNNLALDSIQESLGSGTSDLFEIESQTRVNLGENYLMTGDRKKALENLELVYDSARNPEYYLGRTRWYPRCLLGLGELWLQEGDISKAEVFISELFEHLWTNKFPYKKYQVRAWRMRSEILLEEGHLEKAETELNRALGQAIQLGNPTLLSKTHQAAGNFLLKQGKSKKARTEFQTALEIVQGIAEGLTDSALKEGYLQSDPIQKLLSLVEGSQNSKDGAT